MGTHGHVPSSDWCCFHGPLVVSWAISNHFLLETPSKSFFFPSVYELIEHRLIQSPAHLYQKERIILSTLYGKSL
jgi:hypothetical protein